MVTEEEEQEEESRILGVRMLCRLHVYVFNGEIQKMVRQFLQAMNTKKSYPSKIFQGSYRVARVAKNILHYAKTYVCNCEPRKYVLKYNHNIYNGKP